MFRRFASLACLSSRYEGRAPLEKRRSTGALQNASGGDARLWLAYLGCFLAFLSPARAVDLPIIRLETVFPPGGQAGAETTVALTGTDLDEAGALHFSHPGITATPKEKNFVVKIAPDVPPGIYDLRVAGLFGVSNPRAFVVGLLPEKASAPYAHKPEEAAEIPVDSVVDGVTAVGLANYFKFTAKQGQRLLVECAAAEIDSRLLPVLAVLDPAGQELAASNRGGLLDFTAPADGAYLVRLNDLTYAGSPQHFYRLSIATGPHLDFVLPPCGQPGVKSKFTLYGRNLPGASPANLTTFDGKPLEQLETEIDVPTSGDAGIDGLPASNAAAVDGFSYRLKTPQGVSNPVFISFASASVVVEIEPNNQPTQAQKITPPCEIAGQFYPAADTDAYTFEAKKGDIWWIEMLSQRLGHTTNPLVLVQRDTADVQEAAGTATPVAERRFSTATNDPVCRFEAKEDGTYRVSVRDLFGGARRDPREVYQLSIRHPSPDFHLAAVVEAPPEKADDRTAAPRAAFLRGGGTIPIKVVVFRKDGFAGEIELSAEGLPVGVTCGPVKIAGGSKEGQLLLTATEKPERWVGAIRIVGKAKVGETELTHDARGGAVRWVDADFNIDPVQTRLTRDFALAVSAAEQAPMTIEPVEDKAWEVAAGGKLEIPLKITRRGEFKEALKLKAAGAPGLETLKETEVAADAGTATAALDLAAAKLPAGSYAVYFQALTKGKFRGKDVTTTIFSPPIRLNVKAPEPK